ncbi:sugar ABC transporter ATP-binding protein [Chakrabartyella piscis]|uniref:sugar ABC transporter ATP-binding protein n=1 Tax=Chakrabartyella piscis TaxID=2918914 RepID=UPI002958577C|nr:sugar ABC transporter ATP-binding protein [Chakrabartyella piscis]
MKKEMFRMERITYKEHEITKLVDFNLHIFAGEIMGMIPINSFGLSAFLSLLQTNLPLYDGYVYYQENLVNSWKGAGTNQNRITVIESKSCLVERMTVSDNVFVLRKGFRQQMIRKSVLRKQLQPFLDDIGVEIVADAYVERLTTFERMVVELLKGIVAGHKLIVLKDIESLITGEELLKFYEIIRYYAKKGYAFLYICSHLEDIMQICSRVAVLSSGRIEKVLQAHEMTADNLAVLTEEYDTLIRGYLEHKKEKKLDESSVCKIHSVFKDSGKALDFWVHAGECLVVQCMDNQLYDAMLSVDINGLLTRESYLEIDEIKSTLYKNKDVAVIKEFPTKTMLFSDLNYTSNLCFNLDRRMKGVWIGNKIRKSIQKEYSNRLDDGVFDTAVEDLTEKQKYQLVYERILLQKPKVVFCIQPFRGADLAHRMYIWTLLEQFLEKGIGVVVLTINLADSLAIADRLVCIDKSRSVQEYTREEFGEIPVLAPWKHLY